MSRPTGVIIIAGVFLAAAVYLAAIALLRILDPNAISLMLGSPLLQGLELAGPYMFLLVSAVIAAISAGLLYLRNWARRLAILAAVAGLVMLVPTVSSATTGYRPAALFFGALEVMIRVIIVWYFFQAPVAEAFLH